MSDLNDKVIKLVELANTWQGEGPDTGRQMMIARFKNCNKHCKFCDTWIKMKTTSEGSYSINDINQSLSKTQGLMITGGEPTLSTPDGRIQNLQQTILMLSQCDYQVANIETNGYNLNELFFELQKIQNAKDKEGYYKVKVIYSPKVFSEAEYNTEIEKTKIYLGKKPYLYIKVVADGDYWSEKYIRDISKITEDKGKIYLMPLGLTPEEIMKNWQYCIDLADELDLNLSTRMHIMNQFV
jgi:organic radical activating enzyme